LLRELIWWKYLPVYENGKMRPVETIQRMAGGRIQENY
jgi:hypothetical protein